MIFHLLKKVVFSLSLLAFFAGTSIAAYPERPITFIVPFGAGGGTDIPARLLASMMERKLGKPIIIQNVVGAGGTQGVSQIASAKPDGYTFGYVPVGTMCAQPHMLKLPYSTDSFEFIGMAVNQPVVLMSSKLAPWKNVQEFIAAAKENPNKYIVGITSTGNMTHLPALAFMKYFDIKLRYIPYRSSPEVMKDMMAGRIQLHADAPAALSQFDVYGLVQFADQRADNLDMPTTKELDMPAIFSHWQGVVAPKGIPDEAMQKISAVMKEVVESEEFKLSAQKLKTRASWLPQKEFLTRYNEDLSLYGEIIKEFGLNKK